MSRVTVTAVNIEAMMPIVSVTANPRTGPEPSQNRTKHRDQRGHVGVDDGDERARIAGIDGGIGRFPSPDLLADTLIDEHVGIHGDADDQHDAGDAR